MTVASNSAVWSFVQGLAPGQELDRVMQHPSKTIQKPGKSSPDGDACRASYTGATACMSVMKEH
jgi:hypothetical protein